jgi:hypothetical protein
MGVTVSEHPHPTIPHRGGGNRIMHPYVEPA